MADTGSGFLVWVVQGDFIANLGTVASSWKGLAHGTGGSQ